MAKRISRRTILRGTGAALALPWLESMARGGTISQLSAPKAPVRFACLYFPNGAWMKNWTPETTGKGTWKTYSLKPNFVFSIVTILFLVCNSTRAVASVASLTIPTSPLYGPCLIVTV